MMLWNWANGGNGLGLAVFALISGSISGCGAKLGEPCGGSSQTKCADDLYCHYPDFGCGKSGEEGVCEERPMCIDESEGNAPTYAVCGCDGKRYEPPCEATKRGIDIAPNTVCELEPEDLACGAVHICTYTAWLCLLGIDEQCISPSGECIPITCDCLSAEIGNDFDADCSCTEEAAGFTLVCQ